MSERAPRFASAKPHESEDSSRVKIEVRTDGPEKKEVHPKHRRASRTHHTNFHEDHPSESVRAKRHQAETAVAPVVEVVGTEPKVESQPSQALSAELESEMRQISKLANLAMEPAKSETPEPALTPKIEAPEASNPYELKDVSPEEDPEILTVEAEFIEPEQIDMTPDPVVEVAEIPEAKDVAIEALKQPEAPVEAEAPSVPSPTVGSPAELNGQEVSIDNIFVDENGVNVYGVTKQDGTKELVFAEKLVLIDTEKEKALRAERLKELFDEHSGFLKGILQIAYIAQRMGNPKDRTIRRGVNPSDTFEVQDIAHKKNRMSLIAGIQSVSVDGMRTLSKVRANEPLFGTGVALSPVETPIQVAVEPETHFSQGSLDSEEDDTPLAVSVKALG